LKKKHKRLEAELASHEPAIQSVQEAGQKLMDVTNIGVPEIETRLKALNQAWAELKELAASRGEKLDQSLEYQQFLAKVEEEEAWISEKQQLLVVDDLGDSMAAVQVRSLFYSLLCTKFHLMIVLWIMKQVMLSFF